MALTKIPASLLDTSGGFDLQGNITLGDSEKILLGASSDLQIYHSGTESWIKDAGTGNLYIDTNGAAIQLTSGNTAKNMISAAANGGVTIYHDNGIKINTSSTGATVTGVLTATSVNTGQGDYELYAMDQNVRTTDSPAFAAATINGTLTVTGDLDITGDINSYNVTDLDVTDKTITLGAGQTEANSSGSGIIIDGSSASILWDETNTEWDFNNSINVTGTGQATRLGLGVAPHATAGLNITTTNQHMRLNNGSELGIIHVLSTGELELWGHGDGESINFRTGSGAGTVAMNIVGNNVGIGTDSPTKSLSVKAPSVSNGGIDVFHNNGNKVAELVYHGSGDEGRLSLYDGGVGTVQLHGESGQPSYINSGNVGIGLTNPANKLEIQHGTIGTGNGSNNTLALRYNSTTLYGQHYMDANGLYHIRADGQGVAGGNLILGGDTSVQIWTGSTPESRVTVDSNGQVMIGHTSSFAHGDADNLAIGDGSSNSGLTIYTGSDKESSIIFGNSGTNGNIEAGIKYYHESHGTVANRRAMTFGTGGSMQERMRIDSSGKVGINDTGPSQMLSVSGTGSVPPARFTATGNTNTLEVWGNATASTSTGLLCNAGTNEFDYSAKFRNYAGSTIMEVRGDSVIDIFGTTRLQDNTILALGQSSDARIYYDGADSLYITAVNGTANAIKTNANNTYIMQANGTQLITAIANSEVIINNDSSASVDFRVESDNEQYNFFCDASSEIIHFGEGTNSDTQSVTPARTLSGRRHGYHGGNKQHTGQTFKYSEGTSWTDAIKIDWHNVSWGAVCMRITGQYYYGASNNFSIVIGFQGYGEVNNSSYGSTSVSYDATSSGVETWTNAIQLAQTATGETTIRQRAGDSTGDIIYRYEWQCYARSNQPILILDL